MRKDTINPQEPRTRSTQEPYSVPEMESAWWGAIIAVTWGHLNERAKNSNIN